VKQCGPERTRKILKRRKKQRGWGLEGGFSWGEWRNLEELEKGGWACCFKGLYKGEPGGPISKEESAPSRAGSFGHLLRRRKWGKNRGGRGSVEK